METLFAAGIVGAAVWFLCRHLICATRTGRTSCRCGACGGCQGCALAKPEKRP